MWRSSIDTGPRRAKHSANVATLQELLWGSKRQNKRALPPMGRGDGARVLGAARSKEGLNGTIIFGL